LQRNCSIPPLNNHTIVLYFSRNAARSSGVYRIKEGESLLFPVSADQFPLPTKNIPCSNVQGIRMQAIEINI
jgi:hypothetical protein